MFGPYILTVPKDVESERGFPGDKEVSAEQKKRGGGKAASIRATGSVEAFLNNFTKKVSKNEFLSLNSSKRSIIF